MRVMGIDQSISKTGLCLIDTSASMASALFASFKADGPNDDARIVCFCHRLGRQVREWNPDFVAIEAPLSHIQPQRKTVRDLAGEREEMTVNARTALLLNQVYGSAITVLERRGKVWASVRPVTWRKSFLGMTTAKHLAQSQHKTWKHAAIARCEEHGMHPRNQDQAEAAGIAFWGTLNAAHALKVRAVA